MSQDDLKRVNLIFILAYLLLLFYIVIGRYVLDVIRDLRSEETPIELMTLAVVLLTSIMVFSIFWSIRNHSDHMYQIIWFLIFVLFFIFFWRECDFYFPAPLQTNILGFLFLISITYYIWHIDEPSAKLCILGIIILVIAEGFDNILDFHLYPSVIRGLRLSIIEESLELYSILFFLHAFIRLRIKGIYYRVEQGLPKDELLKKITTHRRLPIH